jgi:hypothetical protein
MPGSGSEFQRRARTRGGYGASVTSRSAPGGVHGPETVIKLLPRALSIDKQGLTGRGGEFTLFGSGKCLMLMVFSTSSPPLGDAMPSCSSSSPFTSGAMSSLGEAAGQCCGACSARRSGPIAGGRLRGGSGSCCGSELSVVRTGL